MNNENIHENIEYNEEIAYTPEQRRADEFMTVAELRICARAIALHRRLLDEKDDIEARLAAVTRRLDNTILMRASAAEAGEPFKTHRSGVKIRNEFNDLRELLRRVNHRLERAEHGARGARERYLSAQLGHEWRLADDARGDRLDAEAEGL